MDVSRINLLKYKKEEYKMTVKRKRFLKACVCAIIFLVATYFSLTGKFNYEIGAELRKLKKAGEVTELSELGTKEIVRDDNRAQLYYSAGEMVNFDFRSPVNEVKDIEGYYRENKDKIADSIEKNRVVLDIMDKSMTFNKCSFNFDYEKGFDMPVPNYLQLRTVAYLLTMKAFDDIDKGRYDQAVLRSVQCIKMGGDMANEHGFLISDMVAIAIIKIGIMPIQYMLQNNINANYGTAVNELSCIRNSLGDDFIKSLQAERACGIDAFNKLLANKAPDIADSVNDTLSENLITAIAGSNVNYDVSKNTKNNEFLMTLLSMVGLSHYENIKINFVNKYTIAIAKPYLLASELNYIRTMNKLIDNVKSNPDGKLKPVNPEKFYIISYVIVPNTQKAQDRNVALMKDIDELIRGFDR